MSLGQLTLTALLVWSPNISSAQKTTLNQNVKADTECMTANIALGISYDMVDALGSADAAKDKVLEIFGYIESYFDAVKIQYQVDTFFIPTKASEPFSDTTDATALLDEFIQWGESGGLGNPDYDLAVIWFNRDICFFSSCNGVTGYEKMRSVCSSQRYIILEYGFNPSAEWTALSHTHEFGHAWNADHDPASIGNYIMSPQVTGTDVTWSPPSYNAIISFKESLNCLSPCPADTTGIIESKPDILKVFPNPAHDFLLIEFGYVTLKENVSLLIFNVKGQMTFKGETDGRESYQVDVRSFPAGVYIMQVNSKSGRYSYRFVKD